MEMNKMLSIGSIVRLKGIGRKIMIFGYDQHSQSNPNMHFEYIGVVYPEGHIDSRLHLGFQHDDIVEVVYEGYQDEEYQNFINIMSGLRESL